MVKENDWTLALAYLTILVYSHLAGVDTTSSTSLCNGPLTQFITCYQNVSMEIEEGPNKDTVIIAFVAFKKSFRLVLHLIDNDSMDFLHIKLNIVSDKQHKVVYNPHLNYYQGELEGEYSEVHGQITKGIFSGVIHCKKETYYVEPAHDYFSQTNDTQVVYRSIDVEFWQQNKAKKGAKYLPRPKELDRDQPVASQAAYTELKKFYLPFLHKKRATVLSNTSYTCELHVVSDHTFFQVIGHSQVDRTIVEMMYHVMEATSIYRYADFDNDNLGDNIAFAIKEVTIYESQQASDYRMASTRITVDDYLDIFSSYDFNDVCLAVSFTHRDYEDGVIGLAWMGLASRYGSPGGLCQPRIYYKDEPHYKGGFYSFNTLLITSLNFGQPMPRQVSSLTLAHEIGHSFGSKHDNIDDKICAPGGLYGHYIMHPYSSSADKPNNRQFSPCSKLAMAPVISQKGYCMKRKQGPTCGNGLHEEGEQCDCGFPTVCSVTDQCCTPASTATSNGCKFDQSQGKYCSPRIHGCCRDNCTVEKELRECEAATECAKSSLCDGVNPECPDPQHLADGTTCKAGEGICQMGECVSIVCHLNGFLDCQCKSPLSAMCKTCCACPNSAMTSACLPADWLGILSPTHQILYKEPGQSCNGNQGYCTYQNVCLTVDQEFVLTTKVEGEPGYQNIINWFLENLVFIIIVILSLSIALIIFILFCGKPPKVSSYETEAGHVHLDSMERSQVIVEDSDSLNSLFERVQEKLCGMGEPTDAVTAIAQVSFLFPKAPRTIVIRTLNDFNSIEKAVRQMILMGYCPNQQIFEDCPTVSQEDVQVSDSILTLEDFIGVVKSEMSGLDMKKLNVHDFNKDDSDLDDC